MNSEHSLIRPVVGLTITTATFLLIPLIAMQFTNEVNWTVSDFILAGFLLFGTGFSYILVTRILTAGTDRSTLYKIATGFALFSGLFLIWSNLAVGIIGSENQPFNMIYFGVIALGIIGAFFARFLTKGMIWVMFSMAVAQTVTAAIALFTGLHQLPESSVAEILGVNGLFIVLFVVSGLMYRMDSMESTSNQLV
ncbi:hypothetical protein DYD21_08995 [Rhodohalobacter sp. SW132]|uniref:hypothetical protein n=1 Tax=Rhodohalobacter sp. SW132 TaxID=2293433 RepID=UPI000E23BD19|nr:hypothetical protein [Rhodohalobacter sp. SW132]REL37906.1 hypothetical protein DYD21_08995 [Rhodohalobacter sp. SW132]